MSPSANQTMLDESDFNDRVDALLLHIEEALDECDAEVDSETAAGILTLYFEDGSQVIVNRQTPAREVWVAARSGGFHFRYQAEDDTWRMTTTGEPLLEALGRMASEQAGAAVDLT
jgi:CyaY protein